MFFLLLQIYLILSWALKTSLQALYLFLFSLTKRFVENGSALQSATLQVGHYKCILEAYYNSCFSWKLRLVIPGKVGKWKWMSVASHCCLHSVLCHANFMWALQQPTHHYVEDVFKLMVLLPLVIQVIITTGLGVPHAARVPQNAQFQPQRSSSPLNQWRLEQKCIYRFTAHVVNFVII